MEVYEVNVVRFDSDDPTKKYNIILDVNRPDFGEGAGRQILVKWVNKPYSECCYEFERDLILNGVDYLDKLAVYERRSKEKKMQSYKEMIGAELKRMYNEEQLYKAEEEMHKTMEQLKKAEMKRKALEEELRQVNATATQSVGPMATTP